MRRVSRQLNVFAVLVALMLAAQPLLHNHSLDGSSDVAKSAPSACAVCATGIGRLPSTAPVVAAPLRILYTLAVPTAASPVAVAPLTSGSRGPPEA
ncbi:MAG: hypothetical protein QOK37_2 [Thermoanaerobaculia bacterium]|nr:hypothetical protein [Thermoanaerobaculia bacterium]